MGDPRDDGWQEPDDPDDYDFGDGGAMVPRKPKPDRGAPAMALEVPVACGV